MKFKKSKAQWVYGFGGGHADGNAGLKELLGGKGANLAEMSNLGLSVPPGFTISTEVCVHYYANGRAYPETLKREVQKALSRVEKIAGGKFGHRKKPLLLSVRSGAQASMPGMMDTVLNIGLNDENVERLGELSKDRRFAWDSYRRFLQMYGDVVLDVPHYLFEDILELYKTEHGLNLDTDLAAEDWQAIAGAYKARIEQELGVPFPQDPEAQLWGAIGAVFDSWMNQRAITYRRLHDIPEDWGTAVTVQAMVFGNMGEDCATGVAFTRNPATGEKDFYGEFLVNAQGEDVVAGIRTPQPMTERARLQAGSSAPSMETTMPEVYAELCDMRDRLESHFRDMQDIEFTVQRKKLWVLQTRNGKRTMSAALKIAVDMTEEGLITHEEAIRRIDPAALDQMLHPTLDPDAEQTVLASGLPASPGAATGRIVFTAAEAETEAARGASVILVRVETSPEDIHGMHAAAGILTTRGGLTSHAAVVARGMGRPCVSGAGDIRINEEAGEMRIGDCVLKRGDVLTIDGAKGNVLLGEVPMRQPELSGDFAIVMDWADRVRRLGVRANAETPQDAEVARRFGAEGIGLCRTEHMFFEGSRILAVREMILADGTEARRAALAKLLPMQRDDFVEIFRAMAGLPVTIRLLDPPLHEFLPKTDAEMQDLAAKLGFDAGEVKVRIERLHEMNPMLGHRGCRLGITYPEIYEMQARAIFEAVVALAEKTGEAVVPEIMIPLVTSRKEFDFLKELIERVAGEVLSAEGEKLAYQIGTMIELPRAALRAAEIAKSAEFFSFGTNDLTQTTFGISRDDAGGFLKSYLEKKLIEKDPFATLDIDGVGELVRIAVERGRAARGDLHLGICGEHGGDPASIAFCEEIGLDYVSCSPYRVPIARLAAAHAALKKA
ncbi:MAG: pyruvate, phosphate dikinase [Alphaproteobacteria bacterium]|nr:pyruvate, phosphate dikinase [Alphaproteobacteria bacterium]